MPPMPGTNSHHLWVDPTSRMPHQIQKLEQADPQVTTCPFFPSTFSRNLRFPRRFCRPPPTPFRSPLFVDFLRSPPSLPAPLAWRRSPTRLRHCGRGPVQAEHLKEVGKHAIMRPTGSRSPVSTGSVASSSRHACQIQSKIHISYLLSHKQSDSDVTGFRICRNSDAFF